MASEESIGHSLCLECGICCDGTLFKDVRLQPGDMPAQLRSVGLRLRFLKPESGSAHLEQPCSALGADCRCRIYADRPKCCRQFECLLLKSVLSGRTEIGTARDVIQTARRRAGKVRRLLQELGDGDERKPLSQRFRRVAKSIHQRKIDDETGDLFGELTVAVHDLNVLLSDAFYPGE